MATTISNRPFSSTYDPPKSSRTTTASTKRKKEQRTEIWSNLLRQTREAQARSRTQAVQRRDLILCSGSPADQRSFAERYPARPPPAQPPSRRDQPRRDGGEVRLSNQFAYGYGHVTLFSPASGSGGSLLGAEAEEAAKVEIHTIPEPDVGYEYTLRRLLRVKKEGGEHATTADEELADDETAEEGRRAAVCILMSWKEPWVFLDRLQRWLSLLARALLPETARKGESPLDVLKEHQLKITVVLQHVEAQESLLRENYTEEDFDYISQTLRTCLLPISAALVYTPSSPPPQQPGAPLEDVQKVLYASLELDVATLQARGASGVKKSDELVVPKHNVVDRVAIVVPSGWDSVGKIRLLSETFSPEAVLEGWIRDLSLPIFPDLVEASQDSAEETTNGTQPTSDDTETQSGAAEVFESTAQHSPLASSPPASPPLSPSKMPRSALTSYAQQIQDPNAHKAPKPPQIEVTTKPEQEFLAEVRAQLLQYEAADSDRQRSNAATAQGAAGGGALSELGDVSFNVGGVSYNTVSAEAAIERLKRGPQLEGSSPAASSRSGTPLRPPRRDELSGSGSRDTPNSSVKGDIPTDKLEEYFASLMKKGGGGSASSTPSKQ